MEIISFKNIKSINVEVSTVIKRQAYPGFKVDMRVIKDHELVYIVSGEGIFTIEGEKIPAIPGKLFYFYPELVHACNTSQTNPLLFFAVHFNFNYGNKSTSCRLPIDFVNTINSNALIKKLFFDLHRLWFIRKQGYLLESSILLQQIIYEVFENITNKDFMFKNSKRLEILIDYIENNYKTKIGTDALCSIINVKSTYLNHIFKELLGEKPMDYINKYRINKAKELLYSTNTKIKDISNEVGIVDQYYFAKLFKKYEHISPTKFRTLLL